MEKGRICGLETEWHAFAYHGGKNVEDFFVQTREKETFLQRCVPEGLVSPRIKCSSTLYNFIANGARAHFDTVHQFEYATPEANGPYELLLYDKAGERITEMAFLKANEVWQDTGFSFLSFKNIRDAKDESRGVHESFFLLREDHTELQMLAPLLIPHLITRSFYTGSGWVDLTGEHPVYILSQRAKFIDKYLSSSTGVDRGLINTRDEAEADSNKSQRLHLILADPIMADTAIFLRCGTTILVLDMIEEGYWTKNLCGTTDPLPAFHRFSTDSTLRATFNFDGKRYTAIDIQEMYRDAARRFFGLYAPLTLEKTVVLELWDKVIELAKKSYPHEELKSYVDWAARKYFMEWDMDRWGYKWRTAKARKIVVEKKGLKIRTKIADHLKALDFHFNENSPRGYMRLLMQKGVISRIAPEEQIQSAVFMPRPTTRAYARAQQIRWCLEEAEDRGAELIMDINNWTTVVVKQKGEILHVFTSLDPYDPKTSLPVHHTASLGFG